MSYGNNRSNGDRNSFADSVSTAKAEKSLFERSNKALQASASFFPPSSMAHGSAIPATPPALPSSSELSPPQSLPSLLHSSVPSSSSSTTKWTNYCYSNMNGNSSGLLHSTSSQQQQHKQQYQILYLGSSSKRSGNNNSNNSNSNKRLTKVIVRDKSSDSVSMCSSSTILLYHNFNNNRNANDNHGTSSIKAANHTSTVLRKRSRAIAQVSASAHAQDSNNNNDELSIASKRCKNAQDLSNECSQFQLTVWDLKSNTQQECAMDTVLLPNSSCLEYTFSSNSYIQYNESHLSSSQLSTSLSSQCLNSKEHDEHCRQFANLICDSDKSTLGVEEPDLLQHKQNEYCQQQQQQQQQLPSFKELMQLIAQ